MAQRLSEPQIQEVLDSMPGGLSGYCKTWGWLTFAKAIEEASVKLNGNEDQGEDDGKLPMG